MRMPPNSHQGANWPPPVLLQWRAACACRRIILWGRRIALAATLQWRAACACRRIAGAEARTVSANRPSMEGGMRMPPNGLAAVLRFVAGDPSMEGGMRMPPNRPRHQRLGALRDPSMEGRHAHAAESV